MIPHAGNVVSDKSAIPLQLHEHTQGIVVKIQVQPRASRNEICGLHGDALKVRLTAPPVDGSANRLCITYLAKCLKRPKSSLKILSGHTSRIKRILVGLTPAERQAGASDDIKAALLALVNRGKST